MGAGALAGIGGPSHLAQSVPGVRAMSTGEKVAQTRRRAGCNGNGFGGEPNWSRELKSCCCSWKRATPSMGGSCSLALRLPKPLPPSLDTEQPGPAHPSSEVGPPQLPRAPFDVSSPLASRLSGQCRKKGPSRPLISLEPQHSPAPELAATSSRPRLRPRPRPQPQPSPSPFGHLSYFLPSLHLRLVARSMD